MSDPSENPDQNYAMNPEIANPADQLRTHIHPSTYLWNPYGETHFHIQADSPFPFAK